MGVVVTVMILAERRKFYILPPPQQKYPLIQADISMAGPVLDIRKEVSVFLK